VVDKLNKMLNTELKKKCNVTIHFSRALISHQTFMRTVDEGSNRQAKSNIIIRSHLSNVDAVYCYRPSSVVYLPVGRSVCHDREPAKTAEPI